MVYTSASCRSAPNDILAFIEPCDQDVTEVDRPDAIVDLIQPHVVAFEGRGEEEQPAPEAEGAAAGDPLHEVVPGVVDWRQAPGILAR